MVNKIEQLPIGTIVTLKSQLRKVVIVGTKIKKIEDNQIYDYASVIYPEGYTNKNELIFFQKEEIEKLYFLGYQNAKFESYQKQNRKEG